jgi:signal-transduction protein with cAMP-binding, CBS, and nucleotidyltransferase domain
MLMRFRFQSSSMIAGHIPDNMIAMNDLNDIEKATLRKILSEISDLQTRLSLDFKSGE